MVECDAHAGDDRLDLPYPPRAHMLAVLAAAQAVVAPAEENWIALAAEAEAQGLNLG